MRMREEEEEAVDGKRIRGWGGAPGDRSACGGERR